jgi:penicillin-binding protein 1B
MTSGTGKAVYNSFPNTLALAGKSGTTNDMRDSWFAGYSGNHLAVVWLGLDNNKATGLTGSTGALPVWTNVMKQLRQQPVNLRQPTEIQWHWLDLNSGELSAEGCEGASYMPLLRRTIPRRATACGFSHYEVEPVYNENPAPQESAEPRRYERQENYNDSYIRESESEMEQNLSNTSQGRVISSGSYDQ